MTHTFKQNATHTHTHETRFGSLCYLSLQKGLGLFVLSKRAHTRALISSSFILAHF